MRVIGYVTERRFIGKSRYDI